MFVANISKQQQNIAFCGIVPPNLFNLSNYWDVKAIYLLAVILRNSNLNLVLLQKRSESLKNLQKLPHRLRMIYRIKSRINYLEFIWKCRSFFPNFNWGKILGFKRFHILGKRHKSSKGYHWYHKGKYNAKVAVIYFIAVCKLAWLTVLQTLGAWYGSKVKFFYRSLVWAQESRCSYHSTGFKFWLSKEMRSNIG